MGKPGFTIQDQETRGEYPLEIYLEDEGGGAVVISAYNPNTRDEWHIAVLNAEGMTLSAGIEDDMIPTDKAGHIKVSKE